MGLQYLQLGRADTVDRVQFLNGIDPAVLLAKLDDPPGKSRSDPGNGDQQLFVGLIDGDGFEKQGGQFGRGRFGGVGFLSWRRLG